MQEGQPSRTAWGAAVHRAAHQVLERGFVFADPLAVRILGAGADEAFKSYFESAAVHPKLRSLGFREIEDLGPIAIRKRYFPQAATITCDCGGHILRATTV